MARRPLDPDGELDDGDTIEVQLNGRREKVRYIGINTPETRHQTKGEQPGGREAKEINRSLVEGKRVRLEPDVQPTKVIPLTPGEALLF